MFWLFHSARRDRNVILNRMKLSKTLSSIQIILVSPRSSFSDEETFVRAHGKPWEQLIDVHEKFRLNRERKTLPRRVFVVTAVNHFQTFINNNNDDIIINFI